jgi:hypothetical protein
MGPILSMTYGFAVSKYGIIIRGIRNETVGVFISLFVGFFMGVCAANVYGHGYRSDEMKSRGDGKISFVIVKHKLFVTLIT